MKHTIAGLLATTIIAGFAAPAMAQEAAIQTTTDTATDEGGLEEIVVTAQRRSENLQEVPISVDVVSGDKLGAINSGGGDIRALAGRVPSLNIESSFGRTFPRFYIRGLGNTDFDLNASQPVSLVYDDVVLENPVLKGFPIFDLERVEVLRGPQGTLFGRNTPAGIVKFDTVKPTKESGYAKLSYGSFDSIAAEAAAGGYLVDDKLAMRLSASYQRRGDWVDNIDTDKKNDLEGYSDIAVRGQLMVMPTENLDIRLVGQFRSFDGTARVFRANLFAPGSNDLIGLDGPGSKFERDETRADGINFQRLKNYNAAATINWDFGPATLTSVSSYWGAKYESRGDIDGGYGNAFSPEMGPGFIPFSGQTQDDVPSLEQYTQELRIASNSRTGLGYQAGVFFFDENLDIETLDYGTPQDTSSDAIAVQHQESRAWGVFGSLNYTFDNGLKLQAGARWNDDERDFVASRPLDTRPDFLGFGGPVAPITNHVEDSVLTWDLSALYPMSDDVNLFARVARGYRAPSIQGRLAFGRTTSIADSEKTMSYEAGIKTELSDLVRFNLTGFYFETKDLQLTAVGGQSNFTTLLNADKVEGYGIEAELDAKPVEGLELAAGVSYNHNEIRDPNAFVAGCASGCTVLDPERVGSPGIYSIDGNQLPQSPKFTANWTARYAVPMGNGELYAFTDWAYRSKIQFFLYKSAEYSDDSMLEGGLRVGYKTDRYDVAAFARNITNDVSAVGGIDFNNLTGFVNEPRIWGVELGVRW